MKRSVYWWFGAANAVVAGLAGVAGHWTAAVILLVMAIIFGCLDAWKRQDP